MTESSPPEAAEGPAIGSRTERLKNLIPGRRFAGTSMLAVGTRAIGALLILASQLLLARLLSPTDLGFFFLALSLGTVLSIFSSMGYQWIVPSIVARAAAEGSPNLLRSFLLRMRRDTTFAALLLIVLVSVAAAFMQWIPPDVRTVVILGALTAPAMASMRLNGAVANAHRLFLLAYVPEFLLRSLFLLLFVVALWALSAEVTVPLLLIGHLSIVVALTAFQRLLLVRRKAWIPAPLFARGREISDEHRAWRRQAMPMIIATLFIGTSAELSIVVTGLFMPTEDTAVFAVSIRIAMFLAFSIQIAHQLILRDAADLLQQGHTTALASTVTRTNAFNIVLAFVALIVAVLFGRELLGAFGSSYRTGYTSLVVLVLAGGVLRALGGPTTQMLALIQQQRAAIPAFTAAFAVLILASIGLIPLLGLIGAAIAVFLSTATWTTWLAFVVYTQTGLNLSLLPVAVFATRVGRSAPALAPAESASRQAPLATE